MKKLLLVLLVAVLLPGCLAVPGALADAGLKISSTDVVVDFPMSITFTADVEGGSPVADARLHYTLDAESFARVDQEIFVPVDSTDSVLEWTWNLWMTGGLPPGAALDYWWTVTDASGAVAESLPQRVTVQDNRYQWRQLSEGMVDLYWYNGDANFAAGLMDAAQDALDHLAATTGARLTDTATLYIYGSNNDLMGALIYPKEWTGGLAYSQFGCIAIGIEDSSSSIAWGKRAIAHELTHLVIHQVTLNPWGGLPLWLDEGLAMSSEGSMEAGIAATFTNALNNRTLISVRSLASPFSTDAATAYLSYGESREIVGWLIAEYGPDAMQELLETFARGSTYDDALQAVYGFDMDGLNEAWQASLYGAP